MSVERESVERLMGWLAEGGPTRSAYAGADAVVERLAVLVFDGDVGWPGNTDRVDAYRQALDARLAADGGSESRFAALTGPDADPGVFLDWFGPVLAAWQTHPAPGGGAAQGEAGFANPGFDGTPGTEFYRLDDSGAYVYAAGAGATDWASYDQRRYSEPARDENYGLEYRYDRTGGVYQWQDPATGAWQDQAWADAHAAARGQASAPAPADGAQPAWDENWAKFYRVGSDGVYEFADAVIPGDRSSGVGRVWERHEQPAAPEAAAPDDARQQAEIHAIITNLLKDREDLRAALNDDDIKGLVAKLAAQAPGPQQSSV